MYEMHQIFRPLHLPVALDLARVRSSWIQGIAPLFADTSTGVYDIPLPSKPHSMAALERKDLTFPFRPYE